MEKLHVGHLGIVVNNIQQSIIAYREAFGIDDFVAYDFVPKNVKSYGENISDCSLKIALGTFAGGIKIELIEVVGGDTPLKRFHDQLATGVHHINFYTREFDEKLACYQSCPEKIVFEAEIEDERGYRRSMYIQEEQFGTIIEFSELPVKKLISNHNL